MILKKPVNYFPQKSTFFHSSREQFPCNMYYCLEVNTLFFYHVRYCVLLSLHFSLKTARFRFEPKNKKKTPKKKINTALQMTCNTR